MRPIARPWGGRYGLWLYLKGRHMLSTVHKADILRKAGYDVPGSPADEPSAHDWGQVIDVLYVDYVTARAAQSLREAEQARQASGLPRLSFGACA